MKHGAVAQAIGERNCPRRGMYACTRLFSAHRRAELLEALADLFEQVGTEFQRAVGGQGDTLAGHVVYGRAEAAGRDDYVGACQSSADGCRDTLFIISHSREIIDVDADIA